MCVISKRLSAFVLALALCFCVCAVPLVRPQKVEATAILETAGKLASYFLTAAGVVNIGSNGGVSRVGGSIFDTIKQKIAGTFGTGIYEDSSGNYVFSESASQELFELINSNPDINARVLSDFPTAAYLQSNYTTPNFNGRVKDVISSYNNQVLIYSYVKVSDGVYRTYATIYDISNSNFP